MSYFFVSIPPFLLDEPVEAWARYYFDRPVLPDEASDETFAADSVDLYKIAGLENEGSVARTVLKLVAELHERYAEWTPCYEAAQLSQGMWAMFSFPGCFERLLLEEELSFDLRARAMRSLVVPYEVYVKGWNPDDEMPQAWNMLWDGIFFRKKLSQDIADIGLECLEEILSIDDVRCQTYALHGLNHLDHPDRPAAVQRWMNAHRNEERNWDWVEACRDGTAM